MLYLQLICFDWRYTAWVAGVALCERVPFPERVYTRHLAAKCDVLFLKFKPSFQASSGYFPLLIVGEPKYLQRVFYWSKIYSRQATEDIPATIFIQIAPVLFSLMLL